MIRLSAGYESGSNRGCPRSIGAGGLHRPQLRDGGERHLDQPNPERSPPQGIASPDHTYEESRAKPGDDRNDGLYAEAGNEDGAVEQEWNRARMGQPLEVLLQDETCDRDCGKRP